MRPGVAHLRLLDVALLRHPLLTAAVSLSSWERPSDDRGRQALLTNRPSWRIRGSTSRPLVNSIMPKAGLEPARLAAPPPQDGVSANSTTSAIENFLLIAAPEPPVLVRGRAPWEPVLPEPAQARAASEPEPRFRPPEARTCRQAAQPES